MYKVKIKLSDNKGKRYDAFITKDGKTRKVSFGSSKHDNYTIHRSKARKESYLARHGGMEQDWTESGIYTAGFWSRWYIWSEPTLRESKKLIEKKFNIKFL